MYYTFLNFIKDLNLKYRNSFDENIGKTNKYKPFSLQDFRKVSILSSIDLLEYI